MCWTFLLYYSIFRTTFVKADFSILYNLRYSCVELFFKCDIVLFYISNCSFESGHFLYYRNSDILALNSVLNGILDYSIFEMHLWKRTFLYYINSDILALNSFVNGILYYSIFRTAFVKADFSILYKLRYSYVELIYCTILYFELHLWKRAFPIL